MYPFFNNKKIRQILLPLLGFVLSFLVCGVMLLLFGINPLKTYGSIFSRAFGSINGISQTVVSAIPMLIVAAGIDFARKADIFNLGAEGQMILGAVGAQIAAMQVQNFPPVAAIIITLLGGVVFGALWALIPAFLKSVLGINEIVVLIMMNQIASYLLGYLVRGPLKDPGSANNQAAMIADSIKLPVMIPGTKIHLGVILAIVVVIVFWFIMRKTSYGYRVSIVGSSPKSAVYAGISLSKVAFLTFLISGGIAGLAGANQVTGLHYSLTGNISNNYGWMGLTVAMISGGSPIMIILVSLLYSALEVGGLIIQITQHVPMQLANIIQAITVLFVLCTDNIYTLYRAQKDTRHKLLTLSKKGV